ncbi:MAG: rod-binding protein [Pseudomonadota bacterium]|nr:rod-binding protein [Pseudomonadota bacterium]
MNSMQNVSDAGLYTDFSGLTKLRAKATEQSDEAAKEVAKQFESLFLQMMLKSMRDATAPGESGESDQTKFYQEMFDKQIALDLSNTGDGIGLAKMLEKQISGNMNTQSENTQRENTQTKGFTEVADIALIRNQIERPTSLILHEQSSGEE